MQDFLQNAGLLVALMSGVVALAKGLLDLVKEFQTNGPVVAALIARRRFWIATGVVLLGTTVLVAGVLRYNKHATPTPPGATGDTSASGSAVDSPAIPKPIPSPQLGATTTAQIWKVEGDRKSRLLASKEFAVPAGSGNTVEQIGRWLTGEIGLQYDLKPPEVRVHVEIPSERSSGTLNMQMTPPGAYELYVSAVEGGQKSRIPLVDRGLANLPPSFFLEINRPGYKPANLQVPAQQAVAKDFILMPEPIAIGVDAFAGEPNTEATRITNYLVANPRFSIKDPESLKALRQEITDGKVFFAKNPAAQVSVRTSLGVDLIIDGTYAKGSPVQ
jgi:hypothetical protein